MVQFIEKKFLPKANDFIKANTIKWHFTKNQFTDEKLFESLKEMEFKKCNYVRTLSDTVQTGFFINLQQNQTF